MPVTIKPGNMKYKNSDGDYVNINSVSDNTTAEQIALIEEAGEEQIESIEAAEAQYVQTAIDAKDDAVAAKNSAQAAAAQAQAALMQDVATVLPTLITNPDSPPLDRTLTQSLAAAPADLAGDLKHAIDNNDNCDRLGLIPYACNGSSSNAGFTVSQNGNETTLTGTSTATESQAATKIMITDHIQIWNASSTPDDAKVFPVPLINGHIYRMGCKVVSGTRTAGESGGSISIQLRSEAGSDLTKITLPINETEVSGIYRSLGENVQVRIRIERLMTVTSLVLRYTIEDITLQYDANSMENGLQAVTGSKKMVFEPGVYPTGSVGSTIDISSPETSSHGYYCAKAQVTEGQSIVIKTSSTTSSYKAFSFTDENFTVLKVAGYTDPYDTTVDVPADSAWVVVNSLPGSEYFAYIVDNQDDMELENINTKIEAVTDSTFIDFVSGILITPAVGQTGSITRNSSANRISALAEIEEGETIKVNTSTGTSSYHAYAVLDENLVVIKQGEKTSGVKSFIAPEGSKYLVVNTLRSYQGYYAIVIHSKNNYIVDSLNVGMFNRIAVCGTSWDCSYGYSSRTGASHAYTRRSRSWIAVLSNMYGIDYSCYGVPSATVVAVGSSHIGEHGAVCWQSDTHGLPELLSDDASDLYWMNFHQNDWKKIGRYDSTFLGTIADIKEDYTQNPDTFYGNYGRIVDQILAKAPRALLIFSYKETDASSTSCKAYAEAVRNIAEHYGAPYINWEDDPWMLNWVESHLVQDHPTFTDYAGMAKAAERLFAKCAADNWSYFKNFVPASDT